MSFKALVDKVRQSEAALETKEHKTVAEWHRLRASWRTMWTPGRIVLAGMASGFLVGRAEPFKKAAGRGTLQLIGALSSLLARDHAQDAAEDASDAAEAAESIENSARAATTPPPAATAAQRPPYEVPETFRDSGQL